MKKLKVKFRLHYVQYLVQCHCVHLDISLNTKIMSEYTCLHEKCATPFSEAPDKIPPLQMRQILDKCCITVLNLMAF